MRRLLILSMSSLLLAFQLPLVKALADSTTNLTLAVEDAADLWSKKDGTGFANDVVRAAYQAVGITVDLKVEPYARCKLDALQGQVAGCFSMSWSPEFENQLVFSKYPIFVCHSDYYYNRAKPPKFKKEKEIPKGTIIGSVLGYEYPPATEKLKQQGIIFSETEDEITNFKKLALGRIDLALVNHNELKQTEKMIEAAGATKEVSFAFKGGILKSYVGFSLKNAQGRWAREKFDQGYERISKNGVLKKIEDKWKQ